MSRTRKRLKKPDRRVTLRVECLEGLVLLAAPAAIPAAALVQARALPAAASVQVGLLRFTNLQDTSIAGPIEEEIKKAGVGNKKSADLTRLDVDLTTGIVSGEYDLRCKHAWSTPFGDATVYSFTFRGRFTYNMITKKIDGSVTLGRVGGEEIRVSLDLIKSVLGRRFSDISAPVILPGPRVSDTYQANRDQLLAATGASRTYVSSKALVDQLNPLLLGASGITAARPVSADDLSRLAISNKGVLIPELRTLSDWLRRTGNLNYSAETLYQRITWRELDFGRFTLQPAAFGYTYSVEGTGRAEARNLGFTAVFK